MKELKVNIQTNILDRNDPILASYLADIEKYPKGLSKEKEVKFLKKAQVGDEQAREIIFKSNCRFVVSIAKLYQFKGLSLMDIINEGNIGLLTAIGRANPTSENKFISYAVWYIRQAILDALSKCKYTVALPINYYNLNQKVQRFQEKFFALNECDPDLHEIAAEFEIPVSQVEQILTMRQTAKTDWLSRPVEIVLHESDNMYFEEITYLSCRLEAEEKSDDLLFLESCRTDIQRVVSNLTDREREITILFFCLNGNSNQEGLSLEEIGERVNLTKERVRQIKEKSISRLKKSSGSKLLKYYLG